MEVMQEILDREFPKGECKERGHALVLFAELMMKMEELINLARAEEKNRIIDELAVTTAELMNLARADAMRLVQEKEKGFIVEDRTPEFDFALESTKERYRKEGFDKGCLETKEKADKFIEEWRGHFYHNVDGYEDDADRMLSDWKELSCPSVPEKQVQNESYPETPNTPLNKKGFLDDSPSKTEEKCSRCAYMEGRLLAKCISCELKDNDNQSHQNKTAEVGRSLQTTDYPLSDGTPDKTGDLSSGEQSPEAHQKGLCKNCGLTKLEHWKDGYCVNSDLSTNEKFEEVQRVSDDDDYWTKRKSYELEKEK